MRPPFTHEPLVWILIVASLTFWQLVEARLGVSMGESRDSSERSLRTIAAIVLASVLAAILASLLELAPIAGGSWWPVAVGLTLIWSGLAFRAWSIRELGSFFKLDVVVQEGHRIIDTGPYRVLRHPSYLGSIVSMTGLGLAEGDWISVAIMACGTVAAFVFRIRIEERTLLHSLGAEYAAYSERTARLFPGVY